MTRDRADDAKGEETVLETLPGLDHLQSEAMDETDDGLARSLGPMHLVLLGVAAIVGTGIFVATGIVASENTGPAIIISILIAAIGCLSAAFCYAEFAAMMPVSGSAYSYANAVFGRLVGWIIGWCLILEYLMAAATVAVGWSGYTNSLLQTFGLHLPAALTTASFSAPAVGGPSGLTINAPAMAIVLVITWVLLRGVKLSVTVNGLLVAVKLTAIILFVLVGAFAVDPANWQPFLPENKGSYGEFGWSGIFRGAAIFFYAYLGFDTVSTAAREARDPQRSVPIGIIGSLAICTLLYILFALVLTGLAPYTILGTANPVSTALDHAGSHLTPLKIVVAGGAVVGLSSVLMALLYGQSRILFAMGQDRMVPDMFGKVDSRTRVPAAGILATGLIAAVAAGLFPIASLGEMISIGTLCAFVFVCAGILVLRYRRPDLKRGFRTPFPHITCSAGVLICAYMMASLPGDTWLRFLLWMAIGLVYFFAWRAWRGPGPAPFRL